jgi:hypothetical protein
LLWLGSSHFNRNHTCLPKILQTTYSWGIKREITESISNFFTLILPLVMKELRNCRHNFSKWESLSSQQLAQSRFGFQFFFY